MLQASGIAGLFPEAQLDDFLFDPMGYSVNGILDAGYFTIHVTPQSSCSYASFETNILMPSYTELIQKVVEVFKPGRATITLFSNEPVASIHSRYGQLGLAVNIAIYGMMFTSWMIPR